MADDVKGTSSLPQTTGGTAGESETESDFSPRKLKIAGVVLLGQLFGSSILPFSALTLVMIPITEELGWSRTAFAGAVTALMWCGAMSGPFIGRYVDRVGVRLTIMGGTFLVGLITMSISLQGDSIFQFYAYFALLGVVGSTAVGYSKVIGALFTQNRGKALAIFGVESSIAAAIAPQLIQLLLENFGWRGVFLWSGAIIIAVIPLLYFVLEEPGATGTAGRVPFARRRRRNAPAAPAAPAGKPPVMEGMTAKAIYKDKVFWFLVLAGLLGAAPNQGLQPHLVPVLMARGFEADIAATVLSIKTLAAAAGTLAGGFLVDYIRTAKIGAPFKIVGVIGVIALWLVTAPAGGLPLMFTGAAFIGFASGSARPMATYFKTRFFGLRAFAEVMGVQMAILAMGIGIMPPLIGYIYDTTGSYDLAFMLMAGGMVIAGALYLIMGPYRYAANIGPARDETAEPADEDAAPAGRAGPRRQEGYV